MPRKPKNVRVADVVALLDAQAPSETAEKWDNVGLLVGDGDWTTPGAVVCIDLVPEAIELAKRKGYRLIINHHPCIFPKTVGLPRVTAHDRGKRSLVFEAIRNGIAVAACHTNFDQCALEVTQAVSTGLGVTPQGRLVHPASGNLLKLVVFVPKTHVDVVRSALAHAGAGQIGNYDECTFGTEGIGTFRGGTDTQPFLGTPGALEKAQEVRLETILPRGLKSQVLRNLFEAHPYEEVAFDLYPVEQPPANTGLVRGLGYGFWGDFRTPRPFPDVLKSVKSLFQLDGFWVTDRSMQQKENRVRRIGFAAGKGTDFLDAAVANGCEVFITGESGYHHSLAASRQGMTVIELGHRESEIFFPPTIAAWLREAGIAAVSMDVPVQRIFGQRVSRESNGRK